MNYIFYGFLVFAIGGYKFGSIDLSSLVNVAAYFLIHKGVTSLDKENTYFKKAIPLLYVLMGINGLNFLLSLFNNFYIGLVVGFTIFVLDIFVVYNVIKGIKTYSDKLTDQKLPSKLFKNWLINTVLVSVIGLLVAVVVATVVNTIGLGVIQNLIATFQAADPNDYSTIFLNNTEIFQSVLGIVLLSSLLIIFLGIAAFIFKILFLVSMFRIQDEYSRNKALAAFNSLNSSEPADLQ